MRERYPGYDVLAKRHSLSWNDATRRVIDARMSGPREPRFLDPAEWKTLDAIYSRIVPQPADRPPVPLAGHVDQKLHDDKRSGFRHASLPPQREAWKRGLAAFEAEARAAHGEGFFRLPALLQDALLRAASDGTLSSPAWNGMNPKLFFENHVMSDIISAYYAHPSSWNEIGFGGPASPRGYVRMQADRRDPWEPAEALPGTEAATARKNARVR